MSELSSDHSDSEWSVINDVGSGDEQAIKAEVAKSSKEAIKNLKERYLAVEKEKRELKSFFAKSIPKEKVFFRGIQNEVSNFAVVAQRGLRS
ncbi:MAG: hypothetical protein Q9160_005837 [Pyrenula sp. 1 TL-2023]